MQANKPHIKEQHPAWSAQQISEESERRWANIHPDEKKKYEFMYNVDLARYYKQKEEFDAGRPIPIISDAEAHELYQEHLRTGTLIKGRKGKKVLEEAAAAGQIVPAHVAAAADADGSDEEEAEEANADAADEDAEAEADDDEDDAQSEEEEEAPPPKAKKQKTVKAAPAKSTPKKPRGKKTAAADAESDNSLVEEQKKDKKPAASRKRKSGKSE